MGAVNAPEETAGAAGPAATARPGVIELLNRSGQVQQRLAMHEGDWRIGRAYDNDVIVDDPYVCPHHLRLEVRGGEVTVHDLDSENGTWTRAGRKRVDVLPLGSGDTVQFGHSQLRYRAVDEPVRPAWTDVTSRGALRLLSRPWLLVTGLILYLAAVSAGSYLDATRPMSPGEIAGNLVNPLVGLMLWAGVWALVNRLVSLRANFSVHLTIASLGVVGMYLVSEGFPLLAFALGWDAALDALSRLAYMLIVGLVLFAHIQYVAHGRGRMQALGAGLAALALIGLPTVGQWLASDEFSSQPELDPLLKPPALKIVAGDSVQEFLDQADELQADLVRELETD